MALIYISDKNWKKYEHDIAAIEATSEYRLGQDRFTIDHGVDYLEFFKRLGTVRFAGWIEKNQVLAIAAGVLRKVPIGERNSMAWYMCALKVHPQQRGKHLPLRLLTRALPLNYLRCSRGYAVSMDTEGTKNRVAKLLAQFRWLRFANEGRLFIWSLNAQDMTKALPVLTRHRGPVSFLSLAGIKDIVLKSTGQPMQLLHAQFGPLGVAGRDSILGGATHMFCAPANDPLILDLDAEGLNPSASATIISHRMHGTDWRWILTSDI